MDQEKFRARLIELGRAADEVIRLFENDADRQTLFMFFQIFAMAAQATAERDLH